MAVRFHESQQDFENLRSKRHRLAVAQKDLLGWVQNEGPEGILLLGKPFHTDLKTF